MVQLILLIVGIVYAVKRPRYVRLVPQDYPEVDPARFEEWRGLELRSIDIFLWATWGLFVISVVVGVLLGVSGAGGGARMTFGGAVMLLFLGGLVMSAIAGSKAAKLRKELDIEFPKRS